MIEFVECIADDDVDVIDCVDCDIDVIECTVGVHIGIAVDERTVDRGVVDVVVEFDIEIVNVVDLDIAVHELGVDYHIVDSEPVTLEIGHIVDAGVVVETGQVGENSGGYIHCFVVDNWETAVDSAVDDVAPV